MASSNGLVTPFVGAGVREDLKQFYLKFKEVKSFKLQDYCSVFRRLKFHEILECRICPTDYVEFVEYLLQNAGNYFRRRDDFGRDRSLTERVFGIYTCYAIYNLQPKDHVYQLHVTTQQLRDLLDFEKVLIEHDILQAVACLHTLIAKKAFSIRLFQSSYDPSTHKKYLVDEEESESQNITVKPFERVQSLLDSELFKEMSMVHNAYVKGKQKLGLSHITLVNRRNPVEYMKSLLENGLGELNNKRERKLFDPSSNSMESAGTSRSNLRSKAYSAELKHSRSRRHMDPNMEEHYGHLTMGDLAKEILNEPIDTGNPAEPSYANDKVQRKRKARKQSQHADLPPDDHEIAEQVLKDSMAGKWTVKPEVETDNPDALIGGKKSRTGKIARRVVAPRKKEGGKIVEASHKPAERNEAAFTNVTELLSKSPEKKPTSGITGKYTDERLERLRRVNASGKAAEKAADKALEKLKSRIKIEHPKDDIQF